MRASVFIATSLDGFIARPDGGLDWLPQGGGEPHGFEEFIASVDVVVIGRKTYETVLGFGGWFYGAKPVVVLSSRPQAIAPPAGAVCEALSGTPAEVVARLELRGFTHAYVDGGVTIQGFLEAGLIQSLVITRIPILLGQGIPLFGATTRDIRLRHVSTRDFPSGMVQSSYQVLPGNPAP
ncbi:MAG: dihydrofolate reductase [Acidobacteria bacterium]|nr:dihydrofolate reductase [Acidobacteriota bacterium]